MKPETPEATLSTTHTRDSTNQYYTRPRTILDPPGTPILARSNLLMLFLVSKGGPSTGWCCLLLWSTGSRLEGGGGVVLWVSLGRASEIKTKKSVNRKTVSYGLALFGVSRFVSLGSPPSEIQRVQTAGKATF